MTTKTFIFSDLNVRDGFVSESTSVLLYDSKDIVQSIWRLLTTEEGEIPNYRNYGINIKQFLNYPLAYETIEDIYEYVKGKIEMYETRAGVYQANADVDFDSGVIIFDFYLVLKNSGDVVKIPTWEVQVSTS